MTGLQVLRVLIVAGDALARAGLAAHVSEQPELLIVGQVGLSPDLAPEIEVYRPDVLIWGLAWDPAMALECLSALPNGSPPVLALLVDGANASQAWSAGASGLILRDAGPQRISPALAALHQGLTVLDPALSPGIPGGRDLPGNIPSETVQLTPRELQALRLVADGLTNKAIADRMGVSENTVKFHVNGVLGKLNAQSRAEAVAQAARMGLILL